MIDSWGTVYYKKVFSYIIFKKTLNTIVSNYNARILFFLE